MKNDRVAVSFLFSFYGSSIDYLQFVALFPEPYGTPIHVSITLADLGLDRYENYNFFESFTGQSTGTFHYTDTYKFSINPAGDVHAFYVDGVSLNRRYRSKIF